VRAAIYAALAINGFENISMQVSIDIPEPDLWEIMQITKDRSDFIRKAIRSALDAHRKPDINQFFGMCADDPEDGMAFQNRMRSEWDRSGDS